MRAGSPQRATACPPATRKGAGYSRRRIDSSAPGPIPAEALSLLASMGPSTEGFREARSLYLRALAEPGLAKREKAHILCELAWMAAAGWEPEHGGPRGDHGKTTPPARR